MVEDELVFTPAEIGTRLTQDKTADTLILSEAIFVCVLPEDDMLIVELVRDLTGKLRLIGGSRHDVSQRTVSVPREDDRLYLNYALVRLTA